MRIAVLFDNFGPYHVARLRAANQACDLLAVQARCRSRDYAWEPAVHTADFRRCTLDGEGALHSTPQGRCRRLQFSLSEFAPHCVFIPGWSDVHSLAALRWCAGNRVPAVVMSESTEGDRPRAQWKETVKSQIVRACSAGLVGGAAHAEYLAGLGLPRDCSFPGYDVVDNQYFSERAWSIRNQSAAFRSRFGLPDRYFLASARFIPKKNLPYLVAEYGRYREAVGTAPDATQGAPRPWSLVLLGDGSGRAVLERQITSLGLHGWVLLPGFKQYLDLPVYYALAGAFVHASASEPWGLVVNEAMASGLPVLVSNRCGCVRDLVHNGLNGFSFDPTTTGQLAELFFRISQSEVLRTAMGSASRHFISAWGPGRFRQGLERAAALAIKRGPVMDTPSRKLLLWCLLQRSILFP